METITKMTGLELSKLPDGKIQFYPHEYVGKEPDAKFIYHQIRQVAQRLGIPLHMYTNSCSDEVNTGEQQKRMRYFFETFCLTTLGTYVGRDAIHVALNPGHASNAIEINTHLGVYKNNDGRILFGKVESERDNVLRPACGALAHVMNRFLGKEKSSKLEETEADYVTKLESVLLPYKDILLKVHTQGKDDLEKHSLAMEFLSRKNCEIQVERALEFLKHMEPQSPVIVFGTITLNRFKYPTTALLDHAYIVQGKSIKNLADEPL